MSLLLKEDLGSTNYQRLVEEKKIVQSRWDKTGFLNGLEGIAKENIAQLYENQLSYLKKKAKHLNESTTSASSGSFETVAFPVIRRVFSKLLANDIVSVQALNLPIGKIFYFNPKISERKSDEKHVARLGHSGDAQLFRKAEAWVANTYTQGSIVWVIRPGTTNVKDYFKAKTDAVAGDVPNSDANSVWSVLQGDDLVSYETKSLYDSYYATEVDDYGTSLFDRTNGSAELETITINAESDSPTATDVVVLPANSLFNTGLGLNTIRSFVVKVRIPEMNRGRLQGGSGDTTDTEAFLASLKLLVVGQVRTSVGAFVPFNKPDGSTLPFHVQLPPYGDSIVDETGHIRLVVDLTYPGVEYTPYNDLSLFDGIKVVYKKYADMEQDSQMAEVTFRLDEITIATTTKKLRANWTPELAMDVQQFQNIDAEAELTALLSETIAAEIDRTILRDLRTIAAWYTRWDYNGLYKVTGNFYGTQKDWNQTLITTIMQVSAQIQKSTLRGGANWIVVSPEVSAVLNDLEYFHVTDASPDSDGYNMGIEKIGSLKGMVTVYRDAYAPVDTIILGRKGSSMLEAGYVYAPYVPMELTGVITDPNDFTNIRGIMTRFAKKTILARYYGRVSADGLKTFGIGLLR
jgi:hypothetical protein